MVGRPFARAAGRLFGFWLDSLRVRLRRADGKTFGAADFPIGSSIYAVSERDLIAVAPMARHSDFIALVDKSRDGEWAVALASSLRCRFVRGSSLHEGLGALRELLSTISASSSPVIITVDGPTGPAGEAKPGAVVCAARTGRTIVPAAAAARHRITFSRSWAAYYVPLPWSPVSIELGEPMTVAPTASRQEIDAATQAISVRLRELRLAAERGLE